MMIGQPFISNVDNFQGVRFLEKLLGQEQLQGGGVTRCCKGHFRNCALLSQLPIQVRFLQQEKARLVLETLPTTNILNLFAYKHKYRNHTITTHGLCQSATSTKTALPVTTITTIPLSQQDEGASSGLIEMNTADHQQKGLVRFEQASMITRKTSTITRKTSRVKRKPR